MLKKTISLIVSIWLIVSMPVIIFAEDYKDSLSDEDLFKNAVVSIENNCVCLTNIQKTNSSEWIVNQVNIVPRENITALQIVKMLNDGIMKVSYNPNTRAGGSVEINNHDTAYSMTGWVRATYVTGQYNGHQTVKLTNCQGGASVTDPTVQIVSESVVYASSGLATNGNSVTQRKEKNPTNFSSWSYNVPSSWVYVYDDVHALVGGCCTYTMKRIHSTSGHTWDMLINCIVRATNFSLF